jgi:hypothetical protein
MIAAEKAQSLTPLEASKIKRRTIAAAVKEAIGLGATKAAIWDLSEVRVKDVNERRAAAVASNRTDDVISIDAERLRAEVARECAKAAVEASKSGLKDLVAAFNAAKAEVERCARAQIDGELLALADKVNRAFDSAMEIGKELQALALGDPGNRPISGPGSERPELPRAVLAALERLPKQNPLDVPLHLLRNGERSNAFALRLAELRGDADV